MDIWISGSVYEGDFCCSTHLTQNGALIAQVEDILEYLDQMDCLNPRGTSPEDIEAFHGVMREWGAEKGNPVLADDVYQWRDKSVGALWKFRDCLCELTWDRGNVDWFINRTSVQA